jgi:threonine synthase
VAEVLRAVRASGGAVVAVEEAEIVDALRGLAGRGLYVEPTSAVAAAGLTRLLASGAIRPHERTVVVLTGSGLKASATIGELLKLGPRSE